MIMKKKLLISLFVVLSLFVHTVTRAQYVDPHYAIYLSSPLGLFSKGGVKIEHRFNLQNALLLGYTQYWGIFPATRVPLNTACILPTAVKAAVPKISSTQKAALVTPAILRIIVFHRHLY